MKNLNLLNFKSAVRRKARWLITLIAILTLGVGQMWAADASSANFYYDNSSSNWGNVQILIGHSTWSSVATMTKLTNSNQLYYKRSYSWGGYSEFYFVTGCSGWGDEGNSPSNRKGYASGYSGQLTTNVGSGTYLFISSGSSNGSSVSATSCSSYDNLNYTYTVDQKLSNNGGSSYSASTASLATVKVSSYKLNSASATSATSNSGTISAGNSSANCKAVRTATVTYSVADVATGYHFLGWYDGDTQKSTSATYSDLWAVSNTTITARFTQSFPEGDKIYLLRNSTWKNASGLNHYAAYFYGKNSTEQWVSCSRVGTSDYYYVEVPSGDWRGVIFVALNNASNSWSYKIYQTDDLMYDASHNGVEITGGSNSQSRITVYTGLSVARNNNSAASAPTITNSQTVVKSGSSISIVAQNANTGYNWVNWTSANGSFGSATTKSTTFTPTANNAVATANYSEKTYSLTFSHNGHGTIQVGGATVASGSTASVNHFTTKTLVATPADGWEFTGWTTSGTNAASVTIGNTSNASTTIKSSATNATVTAGFARSTCPAPTGFSAASTTAKGTTFTIEDAEDINDYEIYVSTSSTAPTSGTAATYTSTSKTKAITDLYAGTSFYAWVRANCGGGLKSDWTALTGSYFTTSTVTVTHTLTNVTKTSGETSGVGGSEYTAVYAAVSGYSMPTPSVTIGGNAATSGTHYSWNSETGELSIPANKITGNIVVTLESAESAPSNVAISGGYHYYPGETISLTATATGGNGPKTYQWYKGGKTSSYAISGATNATFSKTCVAGDAGDYYCKVTCGESASRFSDGASQVAYQVKVMQILLKTSGGADISTTALTKVDATHASAILSLTGGTTYKFRITDGCNNWYGNTGEMTYSNCTDWHMDADADCRMTTGLKTANYTFNFDFSAGLLGTQMLVSIVYPGGNQASGKVIYWDNSVLNWAVGSQWYRIGRSDHHNKTQMTKVPGTANLYKVTTATYDGFEYWHIANNQGNGDGNLFWTKGDAAKAITNAMAFEGAPVTASAVTVTPGTDHSTGERTDNDNCEFYSYTTTTGMKTDRVTISPYSNGTITVNYKNTSNVASTLTSGYADLAHTVILTSITAVANTGYDASAITINGDPYSANYVVTGATTIAASFTPHVYSITYKDQGNVAFSGTHVDSPSAHPTTHTYATATTLNGATKTGYKFEGWYTNSACTGDPVTTLGATDYSADITLYAKWTLAWSVVGSGDISWTVPGTHVIDNITTADGNTTGYVDITLSARTTYEIKLYDLTAWEDEHYVGRADEVVTPITYANSGTAYALNTYGGYNFFFRTAGAGTYRFTRNFTTGTLTITYPTSYSVTYNGNGSGSGSVPDTEYYSSGETVTVASNSGSLARTGYTFDGWNTTANISGTARAAGSTFSMPASNTTLYAKWTQTVTLHDNNGGSHNGSATAIYNHAGPFTPTAPTRTGYTVEGYYKEAGCTNKVMTNTGALVNCSSWVTSGKWVHSGTSTLYAKWTENTYNLTFTHNGHGTIQVGGVTVAAGSTAAVNYSTTKTLVATPDPGYYFTGWTKSGSNTGAVTIASESSASTTIKATNTGATITANFAPVWTVAGNMDGWSTTSHKITNITASAGVMTSGYVDITLAANTDYEFKLVNLQTDTWWGSETSNNEINYANRATAKDLAANGSGGTNNQKLRTATAGTYRFTWDVSTSKVTVTYPHTAYRISMSFGTEPTVGSYTATTLAANAVGGNMTSAVGSVTGALQVDGAHGTQYVKSGETVVFTHSAAASGYTWDKWASSYVAASRSITPYTAGTYVAIDDAAGTLTLSNITANKSVYTFFKENATTITINTANSNYGDLTVGGAATAWGTSIDLGATTTKTIKGEGKNGYMFTTWALTGAATKASGSLTDQQISIKGNGTGGSTGTATATFAPGYVIRGSLYDDSGNGGLAGWDNTTAILTPNLSTGVGTYTATLQRGKRYKFKVYFMEGSGYWRGTSETSDISSGVTYTLPDGGDDITFTAGANGTYTFEYNFSTKALTVTFPTAYTVTYYGNGSTSGSVPTDATPYASGETVNVQGNTGSLAKSNYTLSGWNTTEHITGTTYGSAGGATFTITANTNLYAKWTQTISLDRNSGTTGSTTATATYNCSSLTDYTAPTRTGYTFAGYWTSETSNNGSGTLVIDTEGVLQANVSGYTDASGNWTSSTARTLYAKWTEDTHTVTVAAGANGSVDPTSVTAGITTASGTITATPNTGYHFDNWTIPAGVTIASGSTTSPSITINATADDLTITANFAANPYTITLNNQSATTAGTASIAVTYNANTNLTGTPAITKPTKTNYVFGGYYTSTGGSGVQIIDASGNVKASASGGGNTYTDASKNWKYANNITLYAKWIEAEASVEVDDVTTYYATVADAFTAANATSSASTMTILKDATVTTQLRLGNSDGRNCTLNLNGHTITSTTSTQYPLIVRTSGGSLTITDETGSKLGRLDITTSYSGPGKDKNPYGVYIHTGTLNLNAGTVTINSCDTIYGVFVNTSQSFTMNGGAVAVSTTSGMFGYGIYSKGTTTIRNGSIQLETDKNAYGIRSTAGTSTIEGGKFNISSTTATAYVAYNSSATANLSIQGGYYSTDNRLGVHVTAPKYVFNTTPADKASVGEEYIRKVTTGYVITYDAGASGTGSVAAGTKAQGDDFTLSSSTFSRTGYTQSGWSTSDGGSKTYNLGGTYTTDAAITLYPFWGENSYDITFYNGGHGTVAVGGVTVDNGGTASVNHFTTKTLVATASTGYTFAGWTKGGTNASYVTIANTSAASTNIKATKTDASVTATWTANTYTVTLDKNGGDADGSATATYDATTLSSISAPTKTGYSVEGYYLEAGCTNKVATAAGALQASKTYTDASSKWISTSDQTLYTKWTAINYTVNYSAPSNGNYTISVAGGAATSATKTANYGQTITLAATPSAGYHFVSWTVTKAGGGTVTVTSNQFSMPADDVTVTATFAINTYDITYAAGTYGSGSLAGGSKTHGVAYTLSSSSSAFTRTGYTYDGWSTNVAGSSKDYNLGGSYTTNAAQTFYPHWVVTNYTISYDLAGGSVSPANPTSYTVESAAITLNNPTKDNYVFAGWTGTGLAEATMSVTIPAGSTGNRTYTATWTEAVAKVQVGAGTPTYYTSVADAIGAANALTNPTVTILQTTTTTEVTITAAMTIDLNSCTVSSTETTGKKAVFNISTAAKATTITIQDSGSGGMIKHEATVSGYLYGIYITKGTLNVTGGTIYAKNNVTTNNSSYRTYAVVSKDSNGVINISGGNFEAYSPSCQRPLGICANGNLTMTGGTVIANGYTLARGIYVKNTTTSLTNVTVTATATNGYGYAIENAAGTLTIHSGTYTATGTSNTYAIQEDAGSVIIEDGKFSGTTKELNITDGTTSISGGNYVHKTTVEDNCATNYHVFPASLTEGGITYNWKVAEGYTLTWTTDGDALTGDYTKGYYTGEYSGSGLVEIGTTIVQPNTPTKTGYTFSAWSPAVAATMPSADTEYTATWTTEALRFTTAGNWNTPSNWTPACVPTAEHDVIIQKPCSVDIANAAAKSVVIDNNGSDKTGSLNIGATKGLNVTGTIRKTTDGSTYGPTSGYDLVLESSASGNASLVFNNSNGCQAWVLMYSKGNHDGSKWNWQYVGTPFTGTIANPNYAGSYLYKWKDATSTETFGWTNVTNENAIEPWVGYCLTQPSPVTLEMEGTLMATDGLGDVTRSFNSGVVIYTPKVLANSWTAPIQITQMTSEDFTNVQQTIYLFNTGKATAGEAGDIADNNTAAGTYTSIPRGTAGTGGIPDKISSMQGFYVKKANAEASASITLNYGKHVRPSGVHTIDQGPMRAPKQEELKPQWMKIIAQGSRYASKLYLFSREDFTYGFDDGWDGENINDAGVGPLMYSPREDGTKDAISAIPEFEGAVVGFEAGEDSEYTFSFTYEGDEEWYLNDLHTWNSTRISAENTYTFGTTDNDDIRFVISAQPLEKMPEGIDDTNAEGARARKLLIRDKLYIILNGRIYDGTGKIVMDK